MGLLTIGLAALTTGCGSSDAEKEYAGQELILQLGRIYW